MHLMYSAARSVDTLSFITKAYRKDIEIQGGYLRDECARLCYGPDYDLPDSEQANR